MALTNITKINHGLETRIHLDGFDKSNDINPTNSKPGIRAHNWFTAFFLRLFNKITDIVTDKGIIHVNKNSFEDWKKRKAAELNMDVRDSALPSAEDIVRRNKEVMADKSRNVQFNGRQGTTDAANTAGDPNQAAAAAQADAAAKADAASKADAAGVFRKLAKANLVREQYTELKSLNEQIKTLKGEIDKLNNEKQTESSKFDLQLAEASAAQETYKSSIEAKQTELEELNKDLAKAQKQLSELEKKNILDDAADAVVGFFKNLGKDKNQIQKTQSKEELTTQIEKIKADIANATSTLDQLQTKNSELQNKIANEIPASKAKKLSEIDQTIQQQQQSLAEANSKYDALLIQMNSIGVKTTPTVVTPSAQPAATPAPSPVVAPTVNVVNQTPVAATTPVAPVNHLEAMYNDINTHTDPMIGTLMKTFLDKFDPSVAKSWTYDAANGKFKLELNSACKLWMRPLQEDGKPEKRTPKGIIMMLGKTVEGQIDPAKKEMKFTKGFTNYCRFQEGFIGGEADGELLSMEALPNTQSLRVTVKGTARFPKISKTGTDDRKFNVALKYWKDAEVAKGDHEAFLNGKNKV